MIDLIQDRLRRHDSSTPLDVENGTKEILQEIALYALWRGGFFDVALFQGGTSLRILHGLPRFSEDLDFILRTPDSDFDWSPYLTGMVAIFGDFGLKLEASARDRMDSAVREAVLKDNSIANQLNLKFADRGPNRTIKIKLEIDTNPPAGSGEATTFLDFPLDFDVRHQDLSSNFALKIHALLCRGFLKGRDWFDFSWYVAKGTAPNLSLLRAALIQAGPWRGQHDVPFDSEWLRETLQAEVRKIDWKRAIGDVERFLRPNELRSVQLWSQDFFEAKVAKLNVEASG